MPPLLVHIPLLLLLLYHPTVATSPHICLIGAGITSATISHFLTNTPLTPNPSITIFDRNSQPGGRIATLNVPGLPPIEAGASIIASDNLLLQHFTNLLNLTATSPPDRTMGLWSGHHFLVRTHPTSSFRTSLLFFRRYGLSLFSMRSFVRSMLQKFKRLYPTPHPLSPWTPHPTVSDLLASTGDLYNLSQRSFPPILTPLFSTQFITELLSAITRVNYGQELNQMNALSGSVALAGSGKALWAVKGGNAQIVQRLIQRSHAQLLLNTTVHSVQPAHQDAKQVYNLTTGHNTYTCNAVVLAAPFELADISWPIHLASVMNVSRHFHRTVATFVRGTLNVATFGDNPPESILTVNAVTGPFTSIGMVWKPDNADQLPVFKVFSHHSLDSKAIAHIFAQDAHVISEIPWMAYPDFSPPEKFAKFVIEDDERLLLYTAPLESAGSAMEMSAISGANAAALLIERLGLKSTATDQSNDKEEL